MEESGVAGLSPERLDTKASIERTADTTMIATPPTTNDHDESDLSELDLDDEDEEEIFPDHYWDGENGGRIPVFKPTMEQFRSFKKFVEKIDKYGMKSGIVKVIPPQEWRNSLPPLDEYVKRIKIKNPITQEFNGTFGTYTQQNVEKQRSYNLPEWKALTEETQYQHPAKRGERRRNQEKVVRGGGSLRSRAAAKVEADDGESPSKRRPGRPRRSEIPIDEPTSDDDGKNDKAEEPSTPHTSAQKTTKKPRGRPPRGDGQAKSVASRRLNNTAESAEYIDEKAFKNFNYRMEGLEEYTAERCAELESQYWKSLGFNQPMYAADMPGSLFDETTTSWNVAKLENLLDILGTKVPGVNTAYLYMGMWKATFAWHLEDVDLYSINYIHFGAPKQWYSISQEDARKFERAMKQIWPVDSKNCDQFLRHKTYLISPDVLQKQYGVKVNKLVHYEGEFVITFPYGYHSGYNIGYNCAESVNFATESWLEFGRIARKCNCEADNVWVDVSEIERKLRGEPTPEYYEETDDEDEPEDDDGHLPSPPASVKAQKSKSKKRKRGTKEETIKKEKKKIRIRIRAPTREPCTMCPNDNPWEPLLPTDTGKQAHRSCAVFTPETFIVNENGQERVRGIANIDKARLELKCNFCRSKRGACFQCSAKKCTRAFHATCAIAAGVLIDGGLVPTFDEDGTEYYEEGFDFRCRFHRPKMLKTLNSDNLENSKQIMNHGKELKPNDTVQAQYVGGEVFGGLVVENRPNEFAVVVDVLPDGERVEVEYKWLCVLDPDDSVRPKPSATALPMPENMNKNNFSLANRQDGVPTQDAPFHTDEAFKWYDFYNYHTPPPGYQTVLFKAPTRLKIDPTAPEIYYYLPEVSTDAKVFFTDKAGSKEICAKANFVDRVAPKPSYQNPASKQPINPSQTNTFARIQPNPNVLLGPRNERPYVYKPKEPARPNLMCSVDYQALANQRSFLAENNRRSTSIFSQPPAQQQTPPAQYGFHSSEQSSSAVPLRPFSSDHYYSSRTLPAAYQGEYSKFRRESQGAQTMQRPTFEPAGYTPNYQSVSAQKTALKQGATSTASPNMIGPSPGSSASPISILPPNPYAYVAKSRPPSAAHSHHSPVGAPPTPATTSSSSASKFDGSPSDHAYFQNLQQFPYLLNSYCRRPKLYESPYATGGGFTTKYLPLELQKPDSQSKDSKPTSSHTPSNSISSLNEGRRNSSQWTPPSQIWNRAGLSNDDHTTPPTAEQHHQPHAYQPTGSRNYPPAVHQTAQDFQRQLLGLPSTASRDGAQARMLRDQGYLPYTPHAQLSKNSFGQAYETAKMWNSPQAPTPSPLSDPTAPGYGRGHTPTNSGHWGMLPRSEGDASRQEPPGAGYGPMLPQMGGNETWRYN